MKYIFLSIFTAIILMPNLSKSQTVDVQYLNPKFLSTGGYEFIRLGDPTNFFGGLMHNISSPSFGNGDDFSIFTYNNRDITVRSGSGNFIVFPSSGGNMGIGTTSPETKLEIVGSSGLKLTGANSNHTFRFEPSVNISSLNPGNTIYGSRITGMNMGHILIDIKANDGNDSFAIRSDSNYDGEVDKIVMVAKASGNVGIGTTSPDSKLTVKGKIHTQEVKVDLNGAVAPDYVFEENYPLPSLEETEAYIQANKHLPEVPSAAEMETNGIELKEMNLLLLKKMEEMTLHMIQMNKQIQNQQSLIQELQKQLLQTKK